MTGFTRNVHSVTEQDCILMIFTWKIRRR